LLVTLVGVGPGHPQLLTLRAADAIAEAEAVRHYSGCDPAILGRAGRDADVAMLGDVEEVVRLARAGRRVAVLFRGDPYAFSDGAQLAEALARAGVEFEAVPGLLLETAAPALSGIPLTLEGRSASVAIGAPSHGDTVVLRLAEGWWNAGVGLLLRSGLSRGAPAALLTGVGTAGQRRLASPLGEIAEAARREGLTGEALLVVGPGVDLADRLDTLARRPLHGLRVLVTRPRHQAEEFRRELSALGARVVEIPTIEIEPMLDTDQARRAVERLAETRLIAFASANAVDLFFELLVSSGSDARSLHLSRICAIGPETARTLEAHGIKPDLVAGEYTAEGLAEALEGWDLAGARVLIPRAQMARDALPQLLARRGAEVEFLPVYRTVCPAGAETALRELFAGEGADVVTFTSSSTVKHFARAFPADDLAALLERTRVACIGPVTADTARRLGMRVDIIARDYTTSGLAHAIVEARHAF
jgi:uroporphyrinogen III methyltransferase / synthase